MSKTGSNTTTTDVCGHANQYGVRCGLKPGHLGDHEADEQLVAPDPFCIRASDPFALAVIRCWIAAAHAHKVPDSKIQRAEESYREIQRWQRAHGTRLPS